MQENYNFLKNALDASYDRHKNEYDVHFSSRKEFYENALTHMIQLLLEPLKKIEKGFIT